MYCFENNNKTLVLNNCNSKETQKFRYDNVNNRLYSLYDNMCVTYEQDVDNTDMDSVFAMKENDSENKNQDILIQQETVKKCIQIKI